MRAAPRRLVLLVALTTFAAAFAGCATPNEGGPSQAPPLPATGSILVDWTDGAHAYVIDLGATGAAPTQLAVSVQAAGATHEFALAQLVDLGERRYRVVLDDAPVKGETIVIAATIGGATIAERTLTVASSSIDRPEGADARVVYDVSIDMRERTAEDEVRHLTMNGSGTLDVTPARVEQDVDLVGRMTQSSDEMSMTLDIRMESRMVDEETVREVLDGNGTWSMNGDGVSGDGVVELRSEHLRVEPKEDEHGVEHAAKTTATAMQMRGTITTSGFDANMRADIDGHEWRRVDTGDLIWRQQESTTVITIPGMPEHRETESKDEAVPYGEDPASLIDAARWEGARPQPVLAGDTFDQAGLDGLTVRYTVTTGTPTTADGRTFETYEIKGVISGGNATGTEQWAAVADDDLDGMTLSGTVRIVRGDETLAMEMSARAIER